MELYYRAKFRLSYSIKTFLTKERKLNYQCWICGKIESAILQRRRNCARQLQMVIDGIKLIESLDLSSL